MVFICYISCVSVHECVPHEYNESACESDQILEREFYPSHSAKIIILNIIT